MITKLSSSTPNVLMFRFSGEITHEDYKNRMFPHIDAALVGKGKVNLYIELAKNFEGWGVRSAVDEVVYNVKHTNDFKKVAVVGDSNWEKAMTDFTKIYNRGEVRFFDRENINKALSWVGAKKLSATKKRRAPKRLVAAK